MNIWLICILLISAMLRAGTFSTAHDSWDQIYYTSLAMKLDGGGFKEYNLQHVVMQKTPGLQGSLLFKDVHSTHTLLDNFKKIGFYYYDEPMFYEPPLLSYLIKFSHDIFARGQPHVIIDHQAWRRSWAQGRPHFFADQFYATIVPFIFSLLSICLVFWFCSSYINEGTAIYASLFLAVSPVHLLAGTKIWTDGVGLVFFSGTLMFFYLAYKKEANHFIYLSGLLCACALLTRVAYSLTLVPVLVIYRLYLYRENKLDSRFRGNDNGILWGIFDKKSLLFAGIVILLTLPWFWTVTSVFGAPLHLPYQKNFADLFPFVNFELHRPWFTYLANITCQNPAWLLFVMFPFFPMENQIKPLILIWVITPLSILTILPMFSQVPYHDLYALPTYPALAIGTGYVLQQIGKISVQHKILAFMVLSFSLLCSLSIAIKYAYIFLADCIPFPV